MSVRVLVEAVQLMQEPCDHCDALGPDDCPAKSFHEAADRALAAHAAAGSLADDAGAVDAVARVLEVGPPRVSCVTCGLTKAPRGRSVAMESASGYCSYECPGYSQPPNVGSLFPGESRVDFGYPAELVTKLKERARAAILALEAYLASTAGGTTPGGETSAPPPDQKTRHAAGHAPSGGDGPTGRG